MGPDGRGDRDDFWVILALFALVMIVVVIVAAAVAVIVGTV